MLIPTLGSNSETPSENFCFESLAPVACSLCAFEKAVERSSGILWGVEDKTPHMRRTVGICRQRAYNAPRLQRVVKLTLQLNILCKGEERLPTGWRRMQLGKPLR